MAEDVTLTWDLPSTRQSGRPLDPADIEHTRVEMSADGGANYTEVSRVLPADPQTVTVPDLEPGDYYFRVAVYDTLGQRGEEDEVIGSVLDTTPPAAVVNLQVTVG